MNNLFKVVEDYINLRKKLGFEMYENHKYLLDFISYLKQRRVFYITTKIALEWATRPTNAQPKYWRRRLNIVRNFAQYWKSFEPRTEIPSLDLLPYHYNRRQPYIYTKDEIIQLINVARQLKSSKGLRPLTYSTIFGLLAITGMRISECLNLNRDDLDLKRRLLIIRETKFNKSRLIPVHHTTLRALKEFLCQRDQIFPSPKTPAFFINELGTRLTHYGVRRMFLNLSRQIGLRGQFDRQGPRLHDFRHAFAVSTLLRWYRVGVNVEQRLPRLATYLGHSSVTNTYWYLTATPELLRLASLKLRNMKGGLSS